MEGFKVNPKMAKNLPCYKEGGSVKYKSRHSEKTEKSEDIAKDKAIVKKAVKLHDEQLHEGKETNLSKLKKGGRMKKEGGCVGRYKSGGGVSYGAKKTKQDRKEIAAIKRIKPKLETGGSDVAKDGGKKTGGANIATGMTTGSSDIAKEGTVTGGLTNMFKKGGRAKKYAEGGSITDEERARMPAGKLPQQVVDEEAMASNTETREMVAGPLRKLKQGVMEKFKSKTKTPMKHGGKAC